MAAKKTGKYGRSSFLKLGWVGVLNWGQSHQRMSGGKQKFRKLKEPKNWDHLVDSMSTRSDSTSLHMDKQGCNIREVMAQIHSIPGIHVYHDLYDIATEIMLQRRRREMWATNGKS
uniref:Uncharacterized protein n=1 Tax=Salix viminalis TaxID=40686 RepID=A0A6N2KYW1_SALVM